MATAQIDWSSNDTQIVRTLQSVENGFQAIARRLDQVEGKSKTATASATGGLRQAGAEALAFAGSLSGVGSAAAAVTATAVALKQEYDALIQRQKNAAMAQQGAGEALREVRKSFVPDATMGAKELDDRLLLLAGKYGSNVPSVAATAGEAFSAKASLTNEQAMSAVEAAVRMAPTNAGEQTTLASRYLGLMGAGGLKDARIAAGLVTQLQATSRVKSTQLVGNNLVPGITSLVSGGDSMESAAELVSTLNTLMVDAEGAVTRTAMINLSAKLKEAKIPGANTAERIATLQADPTLREKFLSKATFEAEARAPIRSWLSGSPLALATQRAAEQGIGAVGPGMAQAFEEQIAFINSGTFQPVVDLAHQGAAGIEQRRLADRLGGLEGAARAQYEAALGEVDLPGIDAVSRRWRWINMAGETTIDGRSAAAVAEEDLRYLASRAASPADARYLERTAEDMAALRRSIDLMTEELKRSRGDTQKVEVVRGPAEDRPPAPPATAGFGR